MANKKKTIDKSYWEVLEAVPDVMLIVDREGRIHYANKKIKEIFQWGPLELLGKTVEILVPPPFRDSFRKLYRDYSGSPMLGVMGIGRTVVGRRKDGLEVIVEVTLNGTSLGAEPYVLVAIKDLSDREKIKEVLGKTQTRMELFGVLSPVGIFLTDEEGNCEYVNKKWLSITGLEENEALGKGWVQALHPDDRERAVSTWTDSVNGGVEFSSEYRFVDSDGRITWVMGKAMEQKNSQGQRVGFVGTIMDITNLKKAEVEQGIFLEKLQGFNENWNKTFNAIGLPVFILDQKGKVDQVNQAGEGLLGLHSRRLIRKPLREGVKGKNLREVLQIVENSRISMKPFSGRVENSSDGRTWEVLTNFFAKSGSRFQMVLVLRDLTDLVAMKETIARSQNLAKLGNLIKDVSHEVRSPLFGISATLGAMEQRIGKNRKVAEFFPVLKKELVLLKRFMDDILEFGKPRGLERSITGMSGVLEEAVRGSRTIAKERDILLESVVSSGDDAVWIDEHRIYQVFQNLIQNAIQSSPPKSLVRVGFRDVVLKNEKWMECFVQDSGSGVPKNEGALVFEPFFTGRSEGTGLGLAISRQIVTAHGGVIYIKKTSPQGTEIAFRIKKHLRK